MIFHLISKVKNMEQYKRLFSEGNEYMKMYVSYYIESGSKETRYLASLYERLIEMAILTFQGEETPRLIELGVFWKGVIAERKKAMKKK
jgi:hypothetical protein